MPQNFQSVFRSVMILNVISGICIPGLPKDYKKYDAVMIFYCLFAQLVCFGQAIACTIVLYDYNHTKNFVHTASILSLYISSLFWSIYLIVNRHTFEKIIIKLDILMEMFNNERLFPNNDFSNKLLIKFKSINKLAVIIFVSFSLLPVVNNTQKLIRSWKFFGSDGVKLFNYQVPYNATTSPIYEITIVMQASSLFWTCTEQGCFIYLFVTIYFLLAMFFKYLQNSIHGVIPTDRLGAKFDEVQMPIELLNTNKINPTKSYSEESDIEFLRECNRNLKGNVYNNSMSTDLSLLKHWIEIHLEILR